ncbi:Integrase catalytic domain-containing protein [Citrus sinensis]|uniref:Integrase catalytic domain-containing protein n=1 Tax=Citrus sinensis TaxID=2711 RepID=A0ACB8N7Q6_CITSI|nr:Integrase catalytic domain-containing protein [Citrus sinensis]
MFHGTIRIIENVRHVNSLKKNLLSLGQTDSHGYKTHVENGIIKIIKGTLVLMKVEKIGTNLFMLKEEIVQEADACVASNGEESTMMWHLKIGHMLEQGLKILSERKLLPGLKSAYPSKKKLDVFPVFKEYKARVEIESEKMIKCLRTDNGGEYIDGEFLAFCKQECIQRQFTVAYTPQQNGVAEQMNMTFTSRIKGMLRTVGLPNSFWAEAAKIIYYVVNRSPFTIIRLKTSMEMWTEKLANYSYLHAFGCPVYVMYNAQERIKFDPKSRRCIFLGFSDGVKGYHLWDLTAHKIVISIYVIFVEDQLQRRDVDDSTVKEKSETVPVSVKNNLKKEDLDSFEAAPERNEQEPIESEAPKVRQSTRERRLPTGYIDSDFVGDLDKKKSTTGYVFTLARGVVSWVSKLQTVVALSTTEAEYMAVSQAYKEAIWIQKLLEELGHKQEKISVFCNRQSALHIARNPTFHSRTRHIGYSITSFKK